MRRDFVLFRIIVIVIILLCCEERWKFGKGDKIIFEFL